MANKRKLINPSYILLSVLSVFILSCYGPYYNTGYKVKINIDEKLSPTTNDIVLIRDFLSEFNFNTVLINEVKGQKIESYKILVDGDTFDGLKHKYIMFVVEYIYADQSIENPRLLKKINIKILNSQEGRTSALKGEIDSVADRMISKLNMRFGESNFSVERIFVAPI